MIEVTEDGEDPEALAYALYEHQNGIGELCTIIWRHYGVSHGIGRVVDRSGWNGLDTLAVHVYDTIDYEGDGTSALADEIIACCAADQPARWKGRATVRMSEHTRQVAIRYLDELISLLRRVDALGVVPVNRKIRPRRLLKVWSQVREVLSNDSAVDETVATAA